MTKEERSKKEKRGGNETKRKSGNGMHKYQLYSPKGIGRGGRKRGERMDKIFGIKGGSCEN